MMASTSWGRGEFLRGVNIHTRSQDWENKVRVCIFSFFFFFSSVLAVVLRSDVKTTLFSKLEVHTSVWNK